MTHEDFATEVERQFQFLDSEYRLRREPMQKEGARAWVGYANVDIRVVIEQEENAFCSITVQDLRHIKHDPLERGEFDLDEIVAITNPRPKRRDFRATREGIAQAAEMLRAIGRPVLEGDFAALHERQRKAVELLRRYNPPIQGEPVGGSK